MDPAISPEKIGRPSYQRPDHPTGHNRFCQILRDHWDRWCDLRMENEVPADQRTNVTNIVQRMMLCRDPEGGYSRYICPGCGFEHRVPFSCKTRCCPSCGKVHVDNRVNNITKDILDVPHLHITLTTDDSLRPFFRRERRLLKELLRIVAQAAKDVIQDLYPGIRIGMVYTEIFYPKGIDAARYIGRYLDHPPLATSHLTDYDGHDVTFWYNGTETGIQQVVRCSALDFISFMIPHIPPKGLQIVRYAGLYAHCIKHRIAAIANSALDALRLQMPLLVLEP